MTAARTGLVRIALGAALLTACVEPLELPPTPVELAAVRMENPAVERPYVKAGGEVVLTFVADAPVAGLPVARLVPASGEPRPMACAVADAAARAYRCARPVDEAPALVEGEYGFTVAMAAAGSPPDVVPAPVRPPVAVVVDLTPPVLASSSPFLVVVHGEPFTLAVQTTEATASELPPTFELSAGELAIAAGSLLRYSTDWRTTATVAGGALVMPTQPLDPQPGDPAPKIVVRQEDRAGNASAPLELPLVVRRSATPELRLQRQGQQERDQDGWVPVTSLRERVRLEFFADRPIYAWDGADNLDLPLQCQPMTPVSPAGGGAPSSHVWRGLCLGTAPSDWSSESQLLAGRVYAVETEGGRRHPVDFSLQLDLTAPEVVAAGQVRLVRNEVGRDDELETTRARLRAVARDRSVYRQTRLEPSISRLLVYGSQVGAIPLVRLDVPGAPADGDDAPVRVALRGTSGLAGAPALPRVWVSAVDAFGNEGARVPLNDDSYDPPPQVDAARVRLVRSDATTSDDLVLDRGAFNRGRTDACPIVRVEVTTEPARPALVLPSPSREGPTGAEPLFPAPLAAFVEAFDKAGRSSGRVAATVFDSAPPDVDAARLTLQRTPVGEPDRVVWGPGAFDGDDATRSPIVEVRFTDRASGGAPVGGLAAPLLSRSGGFSSPVAVGTAARAPARVFVEATDETGLVSARAELAGADEAPPTVAVRLFAVERNAAGVADRVTWVARAAEDPSAIVAMRFYESPADAVPVVSWRAPEGSKALEPGAAAFPFTDRTVRRLFVEVEDKTGAVSLRAELPGAIDEAAPVVRPSELAIERRPLGSADRVVARPGAIEDVSRIVRAELLASPQGPLLAELVPEADGSFAAVEVGGPRASPARVYLRATDKAGHASLPVEITAGADVVAPALEAAAFGLARNALHVHDVVSWRADAVTDVSPVRELRLYESVQLAAPVVASWSAPDGASALVAGRLDFPDPDRSPRRLYAEALDKTGASSGRVELAVADVDPPVVEAPRLAIERRAASLRDRVAAAGDAVSDASAVVRIDLFDTVAGTLLGSVVPAAEGTFTPSEIGTYTASPRQVHVVATDKTGLSSAPVAIGAGSEPGPPVVDGARAGLERRPLGSPDVAAGGAGACAGEAAPVAVEAFDTADAATPLARGTVADDGSFAAFDVGTGALAPRRLYFEAIDRTGRRSARVAGQRGVDVTAPAADPVVARIIRKPLGTQDVLRGAVGTCADANAVAAAQFAADEAGVSLLASAVPAADGSVADVAVGTGTDAPARAWLRCVDKAGNASAWAEVVTGRDTTAPVVNYALLTYTGAASPGADMLAAASGAVFDDLTPVRAVRVYTSPWATDPAPPLAAVVPTAFGGFAATSLGDTPYTSVGALYVEAEDKCGNRNDRAVNRANLYAIHAGDHVPYDFSSPGARLYAVPADVDPRAASPAIGPMLRPELDLAGNAASVEGGDGKVVAVSAASETRTVAPTWTRVPVFRTLGAEVAYDPAGRRFLGVARGDTVMEVWAYADGAWSPLSTAGGPVSRADFSIALDGATGTLYLFGGRNGATAYNDLWRFDGGAWTSLATGPSARYGASLVHDPDYGRLVLFRGYNAGGTLLGDQWVFAAGAWTQGSTTGAPADGGVCLVHNPDGRELLLFRTATSTTNNCRNAQGTPIPGPFAETWSLKGTVWTRTATDDYCDTGTTWIGGCAYVAPASGLGGSNAARVVIGRKLADGQGTTLLANIPGGARWGSGSVVAAQLGETWTSIAYDPERKQFLAIEQNTLRSAGVNTAYPGQRGGARLLDVAGASVTTTMALDGAYVEAVDRDPVEMFELFWRPRTQELAMGVGRARTAPPGLGAFYGHADRWRHEGALVDPNDSQAVAPMPYADAAWSFWSGTTPEAVLPLEGLAMPSVRRAARPGCRGDAAYITPDPLNDGLIHSGGGFIPPYFCPRDGEAPIFANGTGYDSPMAYDVARGRSFILRMGVHYQNGPALTFGTKTLPLVPPNPGGASFSYDAGLDRVVMHGGTTSPQQTWEYDGSSWTQVTTPVTPPGAARPPFAYDLTRGKHLRITPGSFWEYEHVEPHRRYAAVVGFFPFTEGGSLIDVAVRVSAGGTSPQGDGYSVHVWDFVAGAWDRLATSTATPARDAAVRAQRIVVDKGVAEAKYLRRGAWLLVTANGSGDPADASPTPSRLELDQLELQVVTQVQ